MNTRFAIVLLMLALAPFAPAKEATGDPAKDRALDAGKASDEAKPTGKARFAAFVFDGGLAESPGGSGPFGDLRTDLRKAVARIDQAAEDDAIDGMVLRVRESALGRGQLHELREAIKRFRAQGKYAVAEIESADTGSYLIAAACDDIVMPESGMLMLQGVRAEPWFYKGMLAKVGVQADFVHVGEAKGAAEPYTRRKWSEPVKENITSMLDDLFEQTVDTITMERPMKREAVAGAIDKGLLTAREALELGLVDRLAYSDELRGALAEHEGVARVVYVENYGKKKVDTDFSGPAGFFKLMGMMAGGAKRPGSADKKIAVVYAVGPIMTGESAADPFGDSESIGSTTLVEALRDAAADKRTVAIVLRVDSPGGSALASDLIWRAINEIDKPVVASMGNVAASGGYYISMGADRVFAEPTTITGSIGVVGGKMAIGGLLDKLGITTDLVSRGANSGMFSPLQKFTDSEREALVGLMDDTYDQFTAKAAQGRNLTQDRVKELGGGRVYSGRQAQQLGLVDELGDLRAAVVAAKELAGLDADAEVRIDTYPEPADFFESLFGSNDEQREVRAGVEAAVSLGGALPELGDAARRLATLRKLFAREPVAVLFPMEVIQ
ncbi:MAG: signal peptide peptidase SppA [Lacipirellulaceae bacterium]